ncbi:MAG: hypothetical protein HY011_20700 [Acidobacteria bacterium]|nr:hypothetical protein [Acidobacteriota bacterium]
MAAAQPQIVVVNSASFFSDSLAPDSMATAFGVFQTQQNQSYTATTLPLPTTLGGLSVKVNNLDCGLFYAGPTQVNLALPPLTTEGTATIVVTNSDGSTRTATFNMQRTAPGIFTARGNGAGAPAALVTTDGINYQPVTNADGSERELSVGTRERPNFLVLFATGIRNAVAALPNDANGVAEAITVTFQGVPGAVSYAARTGLAGLDQINVAIPTELAGSGSVRVRVSANGRLSNVVTVRLGGTAPVVRGQALDPNTTVTGALTVDDQVQVAADGRSYFFDAYQLRTTTANTTVALDLRSAQFNALVGVIRQRTDGAIVPLAVDDQTGGFGNGSVENDNALLLTVLREPGDYFIIVTSADAEPDALGSYQLRLSTGVLQNISYGATPASTSISTTDLQTSAGTYLDAYWFAGTAGDAVQIRMNSAAFDSFLILNTDNGETVAFDDNSGGGTNGRDASLFKALNQSGNYVIIATPFEPGRTGAYTLALTRLNSAAAENMAALSNAPGRQASLKQAPDESATPDSLFESFAARRIVQRQP